MLRVSNSLTLLPSFVVDPLAPANAPALPLNALLELLGGIEYGEELGIGTAP